MKVPCRTSDGWDALEEEFCVALDCREILDELALDEEQLLAADE